MGNLSAPADGQFDGRAENEQGTQAFVMSGINYAIWLKSQGIEPEKANNHPHNLPFYRANATYLVQVTPGGTVSVEFISGVDLRAPVIEIRASLANLLGEKLGQEVAPDTIEIPHLKMNFLDADGNKLGSFASTEIDLSRLTGIPSETARIEVEGGDGLNGPYIVGNIDTICQALERAGHLKSARTIREYTAQDPDGSIYAIPEAMSMPDNYLRLNVAT